MDRDRDAAQKALLKLAEQSGGTWRSLRGQAFLGETTIETANTIYRFKDGVFSGRAPRPTNKSDAPAWESPRSMQGVELIGFLSNEGGLWSLSPRWRSGSLAVITTNAAAFTLTSPTLVCVIERLNEPVRVRFQQPPSRPTVRRPAPPSMTRLQPVPPSSR